jgi:opacity protein-like surface antigen
MNHSISLPLFFLFASCATVPAFYSSTALLDFQNGEEAAGPNLSEGSIQSAVLYLGERSFGAGDWFPVDEHSSFGFALETPGFGGGMGLEMGGFLSDDRASGFVKDSGAVSLEFDTREVFVGFHWRAQTEGVTNPYPISFAALPGLEVNSQPYFGGGLAWIDAELTSSTPDGVGRVSDSSIGFYVHGGVRVQVGEGVAIGLDYRILRGTDLEYYGVKGDADYEQLAFTLSSGF